MNKLIYILYLFIPASALLVFGVTGKEPAILVQGLCFLALLLHLRNLRRQENPFFRVPGFIPLAFLTAYVLIQLIPLPPLILKLLSANTWKLYSETVWLVRPEAWMPISINPKATLTELFRLAAYAAFYLTTVQVLADRERLKGAASFFSLFIGLFALTGLVMYFFSGGRFFWPFGGWTLESAGAAVAAANKSHYAGLMAMVLPVVLAQYLANRPQVEYSSLRERIVDFSRHPAANHDFLLGFLLIPLSASIVLSFSLSGILSSLAALFGFMLILLIRGWIRRRGFFKGLSPAALLLAFALLGCGMIWGRPEPRDEGRVSAEEIRQHLGRDSREVIGDFPLLGTGLGTFAHVYPRYQTVRSTETEIEHAGNAYLEHIAETGLVGLLLAGWFLFSLVRQSYPLWRTRHNRTSVYLGAGAFSGLAAILLHGTAGSTLHAGAIGLYLFFFAGLVYAAAACRNRGKDPAGREPAPPAAARWIALSAVVLLAASLLFNAGVLMGRQSIAGVPNAANGNPAPGQDRSLEKAARKAMRLDPLESIYPYLLADAGMTTGEAMKNLDRFATALRLDPLNAEYLQRLGLVFDNLGQGEKAERLLRSGVENDGSNPERHKTFAFWLLSEGKKERGLGHIRQAIYWGPEQTGDFLALMALYGLNDEEIQRILPERSYPLLAFADYLLGVGKEAEAEENYRAAIDYALQEEWPTPSSFRQVAEFFAERKRYNDALDAILAGIEIFPENPQFRLMAANFYEQLGIEYRAVEEYRGVLALDPGSLEAREGLKRLTGEFR